MIVDIDQFGTHPSYYEGVLPVLSLPPNDGLIRDKAQEILNLTQGTVDDIQPVFTTWKEIDGNYVAADTPELLSALDQDARNLSAIQEAGRHIAGALNIYADFCGQYRDDYNSYVSRVADILPSIREWNALPGDEAAKLESHPDLFNRLNEVTPSLTRDGQGLQNDYDIAQRNLNTALDDVDMEALAKFQFTSRQAGLDAASSTQELEWMIMESEAFGDDLTMEQIRTLAGSIDIDQLPYDYIDEEGRKWVTTDDGTKVRVGSAMDPHLTVAIITEMANDPAMATVEIPAGTDADGEPVTVTAQDIAGAILSAADDAGSGPHVTSASKALGLLGIGQTMHGIYEAGQAGRDLEQVQAPLMSDADLDEVERHHQNVASAKVGTQAVVSVPIGAASTAVLGPGSYLVSYSIDSVTGEVVDVVVEKLLDDTWSEGELARKGERVQEVDVFDQEAYEREVERREREEGTQIPKAKGPDPETDGEPEITITPAPDGSSDEGTGG